MQYVVTYKGNKTSMPFGSIKTCEMYIEDVLRRNGSADPDNYGIAEYHLVPLVKKVVTTTTWEKE